MKSTLRYCLITTLTALSQLSVSSCSNTELSSGGIGKSSNAQKQSSVASNETPTKARDTIIVASSISRPLLFEGMAGSCAQRFTSAGVALTNEKLIPSLNKLNPESIKHVKILSYGDVLMEVASMSCSSSESSFNENRLAIICRTPAGAGLDSPFGNGSVCGEAVSNHPPFIASDAQRNLFAVDPGKSAHLILVTNRLGSGFADDKFVSLVRKKLGSNAKISIVYPKTFDKCVAKDVVPPSNDTTWLTFGPAAKGPSTVFEKVATATGGQTYDLCDDEDLNKIGSAQ